MAAVSALRVPDGRGGWVGPASAIPVPATARAGAATRTPRIIPVPDPVAGLLPYRGLRAGSVVAVHGSTSLLLTLLSSASAAGAWVAVVGRPDLGLLAAAEAGVHLRRLALIPHPGTELAAVTSALLDGMDLVALAGVRRLTAAQLRRLAGRARQRGAVLLPLGDWPGADVQLRCERIEWSGLGAGDGRLRWMRATVRATGRGAAARPCVADVQLVGSVDTAGTASTASTDDAEHSNRADHPAAVAVAG